MWTGTVELRDGKPEEFEVLVQQPGWAKQTVKFELAPGEEKSLELRVESGAGLEGQVVDTGREPIAGALVYWGELREMRDSTLFGAYDPERVHGGVLSDEEGRFHIPGQGQTLSVWHRDYSPASAHPSPAASGSGAATITLAPRGTITGVTPPLPPDAVRPSELREVELPTGAPDGRIERLALVDSLEFMILLDHTRRTEADENGAFTFENVEAGIHGISRGDRGFTGVRVEPGRTTHVTWSDVQPRVEIRVVGEVEESVLAGMVVGLDSVFTFTPFKAKANDAGELVIALEEARAGSYLLWTMSGSMAHFELTANGAEVDLGAAALTLFAEPGRRLAVVPQAFASDELALSVAKMFARPVPESGEIRWSPLPAGGYVIVEQERGEVGTVEVPVGGAELHLPR